MARVELPSGGWIDFKDPKKITRRDRNKVVRGYEGDGIEAMNNTIATLADGWSFDIAITGESLDDLSVLDANAIEHAANELIDAITPKAEPTPDPKASTAS